MILEKILFVKLDLIDMANNWLFQLKSAYGEKLFSYKIFKIDGKISIKADFEEIAVSNLNLEKMVDAIVKW